MCGFAGFLLEKAGGLDDPKAVVTCMASTIAHRGPDDSGAWVDTQTGVALGFQRLSILDLSPAGHQPMASQSGRFVIAFNGEIYNHLELRAELEKVDPSFSENNVNKWRGHSDTETILACFERWGVEATLARTVGMFAIALWDVQNRTLHLARDRFGEKPLYYGWTGCGVGRAFVFGSELKALRAFPGFTNPVCRQALVQYMRFAYVPAPRSIYQSIYKLEPGCVLTITGTLQLVEVPSTALRPPSEHGSFSLRRWWSLTTLVQAKMSNPITDEVEAIKTLEQRLEHAVVLQSRADVPLGAFLSGGVDSSTIVALMQQNAKRPIKTFTVGFAEAEFDESPHAKAVAKHLGTDHAELFVTATEAQSVIAQLPTIYDEPFADSSQIPTHLVCRAASQQVTVAMSGDGGDELFGGYTRYFWGPRIWAKLAWVPYPVRRLMGKAISAMPVAGWDSLSQPVNALMAGDRGIARLGDKAHKLAAHLANVHHLDDLYLSLVSAWQDPANLVRSDGAAFSEPISLLADPLPESGLTSPANSPLRMMFWDSITYLPDDILCKVDRAAMAASLETRAPFLDHRVVELAWQLPLNMKIRGDHGKWALRQLLYKHVPPELIDRPKAGFGIPIGQWLRGPLRPWAESLLDEKRLQTEGYFYPTPIRQKWAEHLDGRKDNTPTLWVVLMFQSWLASVN
jgi:asparagine synthase (glutamine-hydrolysing)